MTDQEEKLISIEYLLDIIEDFLNDKYPYDLSILEQISINAKAKHQKELSEAFKEGYAKGYTDHANLINMLNK
jgi:tRNA A-37 threonylcarbamoyl transferase component Bud32